MAAGSAIQIPTRLPLLLTHESVLLPGSTMRTSVDSPRNMQLVRSRLLKGTSLRSTIIGVIPNTSDPTSDCDDLPNLHRCGSARLSLPPSRPAGPPEPGPASSAGAHRGVTPRGRPRKCLCPPQSLVAPQARRARGRGRAGRRPEGKFEKRLRWTSKIRRKNAALGLSQLLTIAFFT